MVFLLLIFFLVATSFAQYRATAQLGFATRTWDWVAGQAGAKGAEHQRERSFGAAFAVVSGADDSAPDDPYPTIDGPLSGRHRCPG